MASIVKPSTTLYTKLSDLSKLAKSLKKLQLEPTMILKGTFMKSAKGKKETPKAKPKGEFVRRFFVNRAGHLRYGLYTEDLITDEIPAVFEAVKRLPPDVYDARVFRIVRALLLDAKNEILPKDEWITYEEDRDFRYLTPYIIEVEREMQEKRNHGLFVS